MRPAGGALLRLSGADWRMDVRRYRLPFHRVFGGDTVGRIRLYVHVDIGGSLFGGAKAVALRDGADEDAVSDSQLSTNDYR